MKYQWFDFSCPNCNWRYSITLAPKEGVVQCPHCRKFFDRLSMTHSRLGWLSECPQEKSSRLETMSLRDNLRVFADKLDMKLKAQGDKP